MSPTGPVVVVLAAGEGRRLGRCKPLTRLHGKPLLDRLLETLHGLDVHTVVVTGAYGPLVRYRCGVRPARWVDNPVWYEGVAGSLQQGLKAVPASARGALVALVDQPLITSAHWRRLCRGAMERPERPLMTAFATGAGAPAYLPRSLWPAVFRLQGDRGAGRILRAADATALWCPEAQWDLDRPDDLEWLGNALESPGNPENAQ